jgi:ribosomal protein S12 methylthiotransferase accessory factor
MFSDLSINYFEGTHRVIDPLKTITNYEKKLKIAGITRLSEITGLDRVGIPVYSAIRPTAQKGGVSVYSGKGVKKYQAKASAMMEGFERYSAEYQTSDDKRIITGALDEIENFIDPNSLILPKNERFDFDNLEWIKTLDIVSENEYYVPANSVFHPYISSKDKLFKSNTNGLASGNVLEEAVLHGIFEIIERDAWSIFEVTKKNRKEISLSSIENPLINSLINKFKKENINIKLLDLTADIKIPTIAVSADDELLKDPALLTLGVGTHLDPKIAILRALTEAAQSRVTQIHGTREDTTRADFMRKAGYERMKKINKHYFEETDDKINVEDLENKSSNSLKTCIQIAIDELKKVSLDKVLFTNLTRKELRVSVVRVIIPEAELYSVDSERIGKRALYYN